MKITLEENFPCDFIYDDCDRLPHGDESRKPLINAKRSFIYRRQPINLAM